MTYIGSINRAERRNGLIRNPSLQLLAMLQTIVSTFVLHLDYKEASQIIYKGLLESSFWIKSDSISQQLVPLISDQKDLEPSKVNCCQANSRGISTIIYIAFSFFPPSYVLVSPCYQSVL